MDIFNYINFLPIMIGYGLAPQILIKNFKSVYSIFHNLLLFSCIFLWFLPFSVKNILQPKWIQLILL